MQQALQPAPSILRPRAARLPAVLLYFSCLLSEEEVVTLARGCSLPRWGLPRHGAAVWAQSCCAPAATTQAGDSLRPRSLALRILSGSPDVPGRQPRVVEAAGLLSVLSPLLRSCPTTAGPPLKAGSLLRAMPQPSPLHPVQCRGSTAIPEQQPGPIMWLLMKSRPWQSDDIVP